jgi:hypothetical protein
MVEWYEEFIPSCNREITKVIPLTEDWVYIYEPGKEKHEGYFYTIHGPEFGIIAERDDIHIIARVFLSNWFKDGWDMDFEIPIDVNHVQTAWDILKNTEMMWVAIGKTYEHKDELKEFGMRWDPILKIWYSEELPEYQNPNVHFRQVPADALNIWE